MEEEKIIFIISLFHWGPEPLDSKSTRLIILLPVNNVWFSAVLLICLKWSIPINTYGPVGFQKNLQWERTLKDQGLCQATKRDSNFVYIASLPWGHFGWHDSSFWGTILPSLACFHASRMVSILPSEHCLLLFSHCENQKSHHTFPRALWVGIAHWD